MLIVSTKKLRFLLSAALIVLTVFFAIQPLSASVLDDLKKSIEEKNVEIRKLEEDAQKYRAELSSKQQMGKSLKQELGRIQTNIKKLQNDIGLTQQQIKRAELQISELAYEISNKQESIKKIQKGLGSLLVLFNEIERNSAIELFLRHPTFSRFFQLLNTNASIEKKFVSTLTNLHVLHTELEGQKNAETVKRDESKDLRNLLKQREQTLVVQKKEQSHVLQITQKQEKLYQKLLTEQEKKRQQLDQEIRDIEATIRVTIDQLSLPKRGSGVLDWPLPDVSKQSCFSSLTAAKNCITQFFGYTSFAIAGGYNGKGHNGADFRADVGTSVFATDAGTVEATGDTDVGCRGASYGKWILIRHNNNLSTMYAHLSQINTSAGEQVGRGSRIALSGKSGYATGPHLHFGLFATVGVSIQSIRSRVCGRMMTLPIAATNAYLNPLDYL